MQEQEKHTIKAGGLDDVREARAQLLLERLASRGVHHLVLDAQASIGSPSNKNNLLELALVSCRHLKVVNPVAAILGQNVEEFLPSGILRTLFDQPDLLVDNAENEKGAFLHRGSRVLQLELFVFSNAFVGSGDSRLWTKTSALVAVSFLDLLLSHAC